jgi:hypothetical protein
LKPVGVWDGTANYEFNTMGKSDSEYAKDASIGVRVDGLYFSTRHLVQLGVR